MTKYITSQGDTADYIAWKYYGNQDAGTVEALIDANKGLADYGPELPAGVEITLPVIVTPTTTQGVKLWD
jgi:phage tail protein X